MARAKKVQAVEEFQANLGAVETPVVETVDKAEKKTGPRQGIGKFVLGLLEQKWTNDEILEEVLKQFPSAKTSKSCISWYRTAWMKSLTVASK